jgi:hypothetical protein
LDRTTWKYRGQIIPDDDQMALEIHIKKVENTAQQVTILGDASLWKNNIRIYELKDGAVCLVES